MISLVIPSLKDFEELNDNCIDSYLSTAKLAVQICLVEETQPFAVNVNTGIKQATGNIIAVVNNDTIALPGWDTWLIEASKRHGVIGFTSDPGMGWAYAMTREQWDEVGLLDENLENSYEDYDIYLRAAILGYPLILSPRHYAIHQGGVTLEKVWGHRGAQSKSRLDKCKANRQYMLHKWPGIDIDKVPSLYFAIHGVALMKEWSKKNQVPQT